MKLKQHTNATSHGVVVYEQDFCQNGEFCIFTGENIQMFNELWRQWRQWRRRLRRMTKSEKELFIFISMNVLVLLKITHLFSVCRWQQKNREPALGFAHHANGFFHIFTLNFFVKTIAWLSSFHIDLKTHFRETGSVGVCVTDIKTMHNVDWCSCLCDYVMFLNVI